MSEKNTIPKMFGSMVFDEATMVQYVAASAVTAWKKCLEQDQPLTLEVSDLFFFDDRRGLLLGTDARGAWQVWESDDGGETWRDLILNALWGLDFPTEAFPLDEDFWKAVVSARLRPAGTDAVYLPVRYVPYESIYARDFTAYAQCVLTTAELGHYAVPASA